MTADVCGQKAHTLTTNDGLQKCRRTMHNNADLELCRGTTGCRLHRSWSSNLGDGTIAVMELSERLVDLLNASAVEELTGGYQARVFQVIDRGGNRRIAKVLDASLVERIDVEMRVDVVAALADLDPRVCRPLAIGSRLVADVAIDEAHAGLITCFEYAEGTAPDLADPNDVARMGQALAELHISMSRLQPTPLPPVAPLRTADRDERRPEQLLHGDFNSGNLRQSDGAIRIFDFDDCGYGPPSFDVANTLYMVLFDAFVDRDPKAYPLFKEAFVDGYRETADHDLDDIELNEFVDARIAILEHWLDDLTSAPIGIRTATPAWHAVLRSFIDARRGL